MTRTAIIISVAVAFLAVFGGLFAWYLIISSFASC